MFRRWTKRLIWCLLFLVLTILPARLAPSPTINRLTTEVTSSAAPQDASLLPTTLVLAAFATLSIAATFLRNRRHGSSITR
jgi:hypothetical protein